MGFSTYVEASCYWDQGAPSKPGTLLAWILGCSLWVGIDLLATLQSPGPALPGGPCLGVLSTQTLVASLQNLRTQRGRKCSDSLSLETCQAARHFEAIPADKLHTSQFINSLTSETHK